LVVEQAGQAHLAELLVALVDLEEVLLDMVQLLVEREQLVKDTLAVLEVVVLLTILVVEAEALLKLEKLQQVMRQGVETEEMVFKKITMEQIITGLVEVVVDTMLTALRQQDLAVTVEAEAEARMLEHLELQELA
jgi:hypothetical protein